MMETKQVERRAKAGGPKWGSPAPHRATMAGRRGFDGSGWFAGGCCTPNAATGAGTGGTQNRKNTPSVHSRSRRSMLPVAAPRAGSAGVPLIYWGGGGMPRLDASWRMRAFMPSTLCTA